MVVLSTERHLHSVTFASFVLHQIVYLVFRSVVVVCATFALKVVTMAKPVMLELTLGTYDIAMTFSCAMIRNQAVETQGFVFHICAKLVCLFCLESSTFSTEMLTRAKRALFCS